MNTVPQIVGIGAPQLDVTWPKVLPWLEAACERGGYTHSTDDMLADLRTGDTQLWVAVADEIEAVFITQFRRYPQRAVVEVLVGTGRGYQRWYDKFLDVLEAWSREKGATRMKLIARPGWQRVLRHHGYNPTHVMLEKDLD